MPRINLVPQKKKRRIEELESVVGWLTSLCTAQFADLVDLSDTNTDLAGQVEEAERQLTFETEMGNAIALGLTRTLPVLRAAEAVSNDPTEESIDALGTAFEAYSRESVQATD